MFPVGEKEEEVKGCKIPAGTIVATALFLPKLHQSDGVVVDLYLLFEGDPAKSTIATVEFESGKGCALPLKSGYSRNVTQATISWPETSCCLEQTKRSSTATRR